MRGGEEGEREKTKMKGEGIKCFVRKFVGNYCLKKTELQEDGRFWRWILLMVNMLNFITKKVGNVNFILYLFHQPFWMLAKYLNTHFFKKKKGMKNWQTNKKKMPNCTKVFVFIKYSCSKMIVSTPKDKQTNKNQPSMWLAMFKTMNEDSSSLKQFC